MIRTGHQQGREFAASLHPALALADEEQSLTQCFDPGDAFRVWQGKAHSDICVSFYCSGIEMTTEDAKHKVMSHSYVGMRYSLPALLALSRQAFPDDKQLMALK